MCDMAKSSSVFFPYLSRSPSAYCLPPPLSFHLCLACLPASLLWCATGMVDKVLRWVEEDGSGESYFCDAGCGGERAITVLLSRVLHGLNHFSRIGSGRPDA